MTRCMMAGSSSDLDKNSCVVHSYVLEDHRGTKNPHFPSHLSLFGAILGWTNVEAVLRSQ